MLLLDPEQRTAVQVERRIRAQAKSWEASEHHRQILLEKEQRIAAQQQERRQSARNRLDIDAKMENARLRRDRVESLKQQTMSLVRHNAAEKESEAGKRVAALREKQQQSREHGRQDYNERQARAREFKLREAEFLEASGSAVLAKISAGNSNSNRKKVERRSQIRERSRVKAARSEMAILRVEERERLEEESRRQFGSNLAARMEKLTEIDVRRDATLREVRQRQKDTRCEVHKFAAALKSAMYDGNCDKVYGQLDNYVRRCSSAPHILRSPSTSIAQMGN